jgi:hypothetical protein
MSKDPFEFDEEDRPKRSRSKSRRSGSNKYIKSRKNKDLSVYDFVDDDDEKKKDLSVYDFTDDDDKSVRKSHKKSKKKIIHSRKQKSEMKTPRRKVNVGKLGETPKEIKVFIASPKKAYHWGHGLKNRGKLKKSKKKSKKHSKRAKAKKTPNAPRKLSANQRSLYMSQLTPERLRFMEENKYKHKKKQRSIHKKQSLGKRRLLSPIIERESKENSDFDYLDNTKQNLMNQFENIHIPHKKTKKKKSKGCVGKMCSSRRSSS